MNGPGLSEAAPRWGPAGFIFALRKAHMKETQIAAVKGRSSNFELLRIAAMMMIVFHHYQAHGIQMALNPAMAGAWLSGRLPHRLITLSFGPGGGVGVGIFFMLTGFFMSQSEWKPSWLKPLMAQTLFYSGSLFAVFLALTALGIYSFPYEIRGGRERLPCLLKARFPFPPLFGGSLPPTSSCSPSFRA